MRRPRIRLLLVAAVTTLATMLPAGLAPVAAASTSSPVCESKRICADVYNSEAIFGEGKYVGHDEPSLLFYSSKKGSGNNNTYIMRVPKEPPVLPNQAGTGGTFNFQLHPAFWFGMALCDTQSSPEWTKVCNPDTDKNIFDNPDPNAPDYIGHHPGGAFSELQFYPPGWVNQPDGTSCDPKQWCAAMTIDSLNVDQQHVNTSNRPILQNLSCRSQVGAEPVNFAYITKSGVPLQSPDPLTGFSNQAKLDTPKQLMMNAGDVLKVDLRDTEAGFQTVIQDLTTGRSGFMTASIANGFRQVNFRPDPDPAHPSVNCTSSPYAFHPMYSTASEHTRLTWTAHSYNVAFSDEIGHFEYCAKAVPNPNGSCTITAPQDTGVTLSGNDDDNACFSPPFPGENNPLVKIGGCLDTDVDFDGPEYGNNWPGTGPTQAADNALHSQPILFTSPTMNGRSVFERAAFETDLPAVEFDLAPAACNTLTGANCTNPPVGVKFYPIFTTRKVNDFCVWQEGGAHIAGTTNTFGGTSTTEYGAQNFIPYPLAPSRGSVVFVGDDFHRTIDNPCEANLRDLIDNHGRDTQGGPSGM